MSTETQPTKQPSTPEAIPSRVQQAPDREERSVPWYRKPATRVAGAVLGITLAAGGVKVAMDSGEDAPIKAPVATEAPTTPGETTSPPTNEPTQEPTPEDEPTQESFSEFIESFDIEASEHTTPEDITAAYLEGRTNWENAGLTLHYDQTDMSSDELRTVDNITSRFDEEITNKLFTDTESGISARDRIQETRNQAIIGFWISQSRGDEVPFETNHDLLSATLVSGSVEEGRFVVNADIHMYDNGDQNIGPSRIASGLPAKTDGIQHSQITFTLNAESQTWEVDSISQFAETEDNSQ